MSELIEMLVRHDERLVEMQKKLDQMSQTLGQLVKAGTIIEFYSPKEFADIAHLTPGYVREMCHDERLNYKKTFSGRGGKAEIRISHEELLRYQSEGLLRK